MQCFSLLGQISHFSKCLSVKILWFPIQPSCPWWSLYHLIYEVKDWHLTPAIPESHHPYWCHGANLKGTISKYKRIVLGLFVCFLMCLYVCVQATYFRKQTHFFIFLFQATYIRGTVHAVKYCDSMLFNFNIMIHHLSMCAC